MIQLPDALHTQLLDAARAALPMECCGLIEGVRDDMHGNNGWRIAALHPARNLSPVVDRFEIDPADHVAAARTARANGHAIIGCYHSHPNGRSAPSAHDAAGATEEGFLWLIVALGDDGSAGIKAWRYSAAGFSEAWLTTGADLVTSSV